MATILPQYDHYPDLGDIEIIALTLIGEAESLGIKGMTEVACVIQNRLRLDPALWGHTLRDVCLKPEQFSCWDAGVNPDRDRILLIARKNPLYGPYVLAQGIATDLTRFGIKDVTEGGCGYFDEAEINPPDWSIGKTPCYANPPNLFFDRTAMLS